MTTVREEAGNLLAATTPSLSTVYDGPYCIAVTDASGTVIAEFLTNQNGAANAEFMVNAERLLRALLAELQAADAVVAAARAWRDMPDDDDNWSMDEAVMLCDALIAAVDAHAAGVQAVAAGGEG